VGDYADERLRLMSACNRSLEESGEEVKQAQIHTKGFKVSKKRDCVFNEKRYLDV